MSKEIGLVQHQGQLVAVFESCELALQYLCQTQGCVKVHRMTPDIDFPPSGKVVFPDGFEVKAISDRDVLTVQPAPVWGPSCLWHRG